MSDWQECLAPTGLLMSSTCSNLRKKREPVPMSSNLPLAYRLLVRTLRFIMRVFFREVACEGSEHVPDDRGGLLVAWHPNGLIDPALIMALFPGRIVFGARDGLLRWPIVGRILREVGTVPIYRASDNKSMSGEERHAANQRSLDALSNELVAGSYSALFPEGLSHDHPHLAELKSGAARLYYNARERDESDKPPVIIPVGLHYDRKQVFRSSVLVTFHEPMELPPGLDVRPSPDDSEEVRNERITSLMGEIEETLVRVVHATDDWELHNLMHRARTLSRAEHAARMGSESHKATIANRYLAFAQIWHGYQTRKESHPEEMESLHRELHGYDRLMRTMRLRDYDLDKSRRLASPLFFGLLLFQAILVYLLLPPILLLGYLISGPVHLLIGWTVRKYSKAKKDTASLKLLGGLVLYPFAWALAGLLAAIAHTRLQAYFPAMPNAPVLVGIIVFFLGFLSWVLVLYYNQLARETMNAIRVRLTRRRQKTTVERLRRMRSDLFDRFTALREGLVLPDDVTDLHEDQGQARPTGD